ncbi:hypothetical protein [Streptomyces sp. C10-9-1]|uniref:hypothetical protein n=1 Tax=Streptomyces sp. C10-9-1 TaxID=1859285 RepID=UPI003F49DBF8
MPAYLIRHPAEKRLEDVLIEDDSLTLTVRYGWAVFEDARGLCYALPADSGAHIQRLDPDPPPEPADTPPA